MRRRIIGSEARRPGDRGAPVVSVLGRRRRPRRTFLEIVVSAAIAFVSLYTGKNR